ncbi:MAG: 50S ribosomal protein L5 [Candidatus Aenigmarchaeota archaeon]|jgi:large subunit ribosomal protein L5|nr:50S ribosomal protein L5 [Candidatus Aenigmarchaeota archaeon]
MNPMLEIRVEKIVLNIGCGTTHKLEHAKIIVEKVSGSKSVITKTRKRSTFNVPKDKPIGCKVTIRKKTKELLKRLLEAKENKLAASNFDATGNVSFGIKEYIEVPGLEYDPQIAILGFDVSVALERPGYKVRRRKITSKLGKKHQITKEEAISFMKKEFNVIVD